MSAPLKRVEQCDPARLRDCAGYEGLYAACEDGRIWSYGKRRRRWGIWLRFATNADGYLMVSLRDASGKAKSHLVHRLVASAFLPKGDPACSEVNHLNGLKTDNRAANLEWCTPQQNVEHAFQSGLAKNGRPTQREHARIAARLGNAKRAALQRAQTHCKYGHPLSGDNLRIYNGKRKCVICARRLSRAHYLQQRVGVSS